MTVHALRPRAIPAINAGDRLRALRRELGLPQPKFAQLIGVKQPTLGAWESGRNIGAIDADVARHVERVVGIPGLAVWLIFGDDMGGINPYGGQPAALPHLDLNQKPFGFRYAPKAA